MNRRALREIRRLWSRRAARQGLDALGPTACASDNESGGDGTQDTGTGGTDETTTSSTSTTGADTSSESSSSESSSTGEVGPPQSDCAATGTARDRGRDRGRAARIPPARLPCAGGRDRCSRATRLLGMLRVED